MQQTGKAKPQFVLRIKIPKNYNQKAPNPFAIFINHSFFILTHNQKKKKKKFTESRNNPNENNCN